MPVVFICYSPSYSSIFSSSLRPACMWMDPRETIRVNWESQLPLSLSSTSWSRQHNCNDDHRLRISMVCIGSLHLCKRRRQRHRRQLHHIYLVGALIHAECLPVCQYLFSSVPVLFSLARRHLDVCRIYLHVLLHFFLQKKQPVCCSKGNQNKPSLSPLKLPPSPLSQAVTKRQTTSPS